MRGTLAAVAVELLREPPESRVRLLQEADFSGDKDGSLAGSLRTWTLGVLRALKARPPTRRVDGSEMVVTEETVGWALSVASVNVHGTGKKGRHGKVDPERGVLGLLASMMEHDCTPSTHTEVGSVEGGSVITLRTNRRVRAGESLSITYVAQDTPVDERRRQLRVQHGFVCACQRCVDELAAAGESGGESSWRHSWENRAWGGLDPYSGEMQMDSG